MESPKKEANKSYEKKRVLRPVSFNTETESELIEWAKSVSFSKWVKEKIREEMGK